MTYAASALPEVACAPYSGKGDYKWTPRGEPFTEKRQNAFGNAACALPLLGYGEKQGNSELNDNKVFFSKFAV